MTPGTKPSGAALHLALAALLAGVPLRVLAERDPTRPPELGTPAAPASPAAAPNAVATPPHALLVVDGRRYVLEGSRLRGVGDRLGKARIQNIEDAAVVVRDDGGVRRLPLYTGVVKRPLQQARPAASSSR